MSRHFVLFLLCGVVASQTVPDFSIIERLWTNVVRNGQLFSQKFTKGIYTVPGYSAREDTDNSMPPFYPSPECGDQLLNLTEGSFGDITSPNYPYNYPPDLQCEWVVEGIPGTVVEATFFDVVTQPWLFGFSDYVMVSNTGNWDKYRRFAGDVNHKMPFSIISRENRFVIRLVTSKWLNFRGFKMSYVVRVMKHTDEAPETNEFGSVHNNDLVAVCNSKPIASGPERVNTRFHGRKANSRDELLARLELQAETRIVHGRETYPHQFPFMVIILTNQGAFCGGSLIDTNHVLTAAHCLDLANSDEELYNVDLVFGVYNLTNRAENLYARQFRSILHSEIASNVYIHPHYDPSSGANDIAIIRVNKIKVTKYVQPVFLPSVYTESNAFTGWQMKTLGWGSVDGNKTATRLSPTVQEAAATAIPIANCRATFSGSVTGKHICSLNPFAKPVPTRPTTTAVPPPTEIGTTVGETASTSTAPTVEETSVTEAATTVHSEIEESTTASSVTVASETFEQSDEEQVEAKIEYESPCHGDSGGPLIAEFEESYLEHDEDESINPNGAGPSMHDCVNAKENGVTSSSNKHSTDTVCQRPKDTREKWFVQVGVLSFGSRVCGRSIPVVYTRVTAHLQWIAYITGRHG